LAARVFFIASGDWIFFTMHSEQQLSVQQASEQLQELDRQLMKRAITEIVYRNRKEKILASIVRSDTQPRYTTRRQLRALTPERPQQQQQQQHQKPPGQSLDPLTEKNKLPQRQYQPTRLLMQELDDFVVSDDNESQLSSFYDSDETVEALLSSDDEVDDMDRLVEKVVQRINVSTTASVVAPPPVASAVKEVPKILTDEEREEKERAEHFASVTIKFNPEDRRPMFPPKGPRTLEIDFGTNKR
jgi:hypothetical protein